MAAVYVVRGGATYIVVGTGARTAKWKISDFVQFFTIYIYPQNKSLCTHDTNAPFLNSIGLRRMVWMFGGVDWMGLDGKVHLLGLDCWIVDNFN